MKMLKTLEMEYNKHPKIFRIQGVYQKMKIMLYKSKQYNLGHFLKMVGLQRQLIIVNQHRYSQVSEN